MSHQSSGSPRKRKAANDRPKKAYPEFPLYPHPLGYWSKKVAGIIRHHGRWGRVVGGKMTPLPYEESWCDVLATCKAHVDDDMAGRARRVQADVFTVAALCNRFLTGKRHKLQAGEIGPRMFEDWRQTTDLIVAAFGDNRPVDGLAADDFEEVRADMACRWGPVWLGNAISRVRSVLEYALDIGLIERPARFGSEF